MISEPDEKIADFWDKMYLPHIERTVKASTNHGYKKIWDQHLSVEFSQFTLNEYKTHHATKFLTKLADERLGVRTIAHIKSLASACSGTHCDSAKLKLIHGLMLVRCSPAKRPEATHAYTLDEAETISNTLIHHPPCQLVFCLATFLGLRPGEISALQWDDVGVDAEGLTWVHVRRSAWRGIVGTTKTDESVAGVPLIEPVRSRLDAWRGRLPNKWVHRGRSRIG